MAWRNDSRCCRHVHKLRLRRWAMKQSEVDLIKLLNLSKEEKKVNFTHFFILSNMNSLSRVRPQPTIVPVPPRNRLDDWARVGKAIGWIEGENVKRRRRNLRETFKISRGHKIITKKNVFTWWRCHWGACANCNEDVVDNLLVPPYVALQRPQKHYVHLLALPHATIHQDNGPPIYQDDNENWW